MLHRPQSQLVAGREIVDSDVLKDICLIQELKTSHSLILLGFREISKIDFGNDFYFNPLSLLSSGIERLLKCYICLAYFEKERIYPNTKMLRSFGGRGGHDIRKLIETVLNNFYSNQNIQALKEDEEYLQSDTDINRLLNILSMFNAESRYYNLNIVTSDSDNPKDAERYWQEFEMGIMQKSPEIYAYYLSNKTDYIDGVYSYISKTIIILLEKFVRAIGRQFNLGRLGDKVRRLTMIYYDFWTMSDDMIGTRSYLYIKA
jgi:hypothetical protein